MRKFKTTIGRTIALAIIPLVLFSVSAGSVHAFTVPPWVYKAFFRIAVWGANTLANNVNLNVLDKPKVTPYDSHSWKVELGSIKFNNRSLNTGHVVGYKTKIATTWHQSWTRTHVAMLATKRSFTSGSKYIVPEVVTPDGIVDLERMRSGNFRFYEAYGNTPDIGEYDFRFIYHDSETWDISLTFNDVFRPDIPIYPQSFIVDPLQDEYNSQTSGARLYRFPSVLSKSYSDSYQIKQKTALTLQELIDEKTDPFSNEEVDAIIHYDKGDMVVFGDIIKSISYNSTRNVTEFKYESTVDEMCALEFYGDLSNDYSVGDYMQLRFHVVEIGNINGIALESFDYLEDYDFDGDAAPHIEPYL